MQKRELGTVEVSALGLGCMDISTNYYGTPFKGEVVMSTKFDFDTAYRDILDLMERGLLARSAEGGRNTSYVLAKVPKAAGEEKTEKRSKNRALVVST
jgi:hypothetical protein